MSTDKAVEPHSIMGASKRIAELILMANSEGVTRMSAVRLGNVWRSQGSVVELFSEQIAAGGPVTITHPEVRRFFISMEAAVGAIVAALEPRDGGVLVAPEVGEAQRVLDVAEELIAQSEREPRIVFTQLRPGDKMVEAMISSRERWVGEEGHVLRAIASPAISSSALQRGARGAETKRDAAGSGQADRSRAGVSSGVCSECSDPDGAEAGRRRDSMKRTIAVVTSSRADYSHLYWPLKDLQAREDVVLKLIVMAAHLSPQFGMTIGEMERDGFDVAARVECLLSSDSDVGMAKDAGHRDHGTQRRAGSDASRPAAAYR